MYHDSDQSNPPSDVCLLLRAYAEQRWLSREVVPVLRQLQSTDELPEEQLGAALAYLEVTWLEAARHATETEAAFAALEETAPDTEEALPSKARRYHVAVRFLREAVARHVDAFIAAPCNTERAREHAGF
ncbi:MAG TPA: hypothetical protein VG053_07450 [Solirubrobacteraceae bacterium]|jgi:hypothetical protein|nr:hypothetical protein [Solirubrobacteraceae bacterium]